MSPIGDSQRSAAQHSSDMGTRGCGGVGVHNTDPPPPLTAGPGMGAVELSDRLHPSKVTCGTNKEAANAKNPAGRVFLLFLSVAFPRPSVG